MKLSEINYDFKKPIEVEILNPTTGRGFETPAYISMYSMESKKGIVAQTSIYREMLAYQEAQRELTEDELRDVSAKYLSTIVTGWRGIQDADGNEVEYSEDNAYRLLKDYPIIFDTVNISSSQVGKFLRE